MATSSKKPAKATTHKRIGFDDQTITGSSYTKKPPKFQVKDGFVYRVRVLTDPEIFYGANVGNEGKGAFLNSCAPIEAIEAEDEAACAEACPLFEKGYDIKQKFVSLIHLIAMRKQGSQKWQRKDEVLPWVFDPGKYTTLRSINDTLPKSAKTGKRLPLRWCELEIQCTSDASAQKFQKLSIVGITHKDQMLCTSAESGEIAAPYFPDEKYDPNATPDDVAAYLENEGRKGLLKSIDRLENGRDDEDEFDKDDEKPDRRASKKGSGKKKPKPEEDEDESIDEADIDEDDIDF